jgi:hypothetical protein
MARVIIDDTQLRAAIVAHDASLDAHRDAVADYKAAVDVFCAAAFDAADREEKRRASGEAGVRAVAAEKAAHEALWDVIAAASLALCDATPAPEGN